MGLRMLSGEGLSIAPLLLPLTVCTVSLCVFPTKFTLLFAWCIQHRRAWSASECMPERTGAQGAHGTHGAQGAQPERTGSATERIQLSPPQFRVGGARLC